MARPKPPGRLLEAPSNESPRGMIVTGLVFASGRNRIRLTAPCNAFPCRGRRIHGRRPGGRLPSDDGRSAGRFEARLD